MPNLAKKLILISKRKFNLGYQQQQVSCLQTIAILNAIILLLVSNKIELDTQDNVCNFSYYFKSIYNG